MRSAIMAEAMNATAKNASATLHTARTPPGLASRFSRAIAATRRRYRANAAGARIRARGRLRGR